MIDEEALKAMFTYRAPRSPEEIDQYKRIREAGHAFAQTILVETPPSADQSAAIRKAREAVFVANAALAIHGPWPKQEVVSGS